MGGILNPISRPWLRPWYQQYCYQKVHVIIRGSVLKYNCCSFVFFQLICQYLFILVKYLTLSACYGDHLAMGEDHAWSITDRFVVFCSLLC